MYPVMALSASQLPPECGGLAPAQTPALVQPDKRFTAKEVEVDGRSVTLTLHEPSPKEMDGVLVDRAELARVDVALFVFDCTSPASFDFTSRQLHRLVRPLAPLEPTLASRNGAYDV